MTKDASALEELLVFEDWWFNKYLTRGYRPRASPMEYARDAFQAAMSARLSGVSDHEHEHSLFLRCLSCNRWGTPMPNDTKCGNCGSLDTVEYFPRCCIAPDREDKKEKD